MYQSSARPDKRRLQRMLLANNGTGRTAGETARWSASSRGLPYGHTHSRNGVGWCYNAAGYLVCPENQGSYSNDFSQAAVWANYAGCVVQQNATGPAGQANYAWTLTGTGAQFLGRYPNTATSGVLTREWHVQSFKVKKTVGPQGHYPVVFFTGGVGQCAVATIDTTNGVMVKWTAYTGLVLDVASDPRITDTGDGFWRVEQSVLVPDTVNSNLTYLIPAGTANLAQTTGVLDTGCSGSTVFCEVQFQRGYYATEYGDTTAAGKSLPCYESDPVTGTVRLKQRWAQTNSCLQCEDITTAPWTGGGAAGSSVKNAVGRTGAPNSAWTVTDSDATAFYDRYQAITVPDDSNMHRHKWWVLKTSGGTSKTVGFVLSLVATSAQIRLNTDNGAVLYSSASPGAGAVITDEGLWWGVELYVTNNSSGAVILYPILYPATAANGSGVDVASTTGSCVIDGQITVLNCPGGITDYVRTFAVPAATGEDNLGWDNSVYPLVSASASFIAAKMVARGAQSGAQQIVLSGYSSGTEGSPIYKDGSGNGQMYLGGAYGPVTFAAWNPANGDEDTVAVTWGGATQTGSKDGVLGTPSGFAANASFSSSFRWGGTAGGVQPVAIDIEKIVIARSKANDVRLLSPFT